MDKYDENKSFVFIRANLHEFPEIPSDCIAVDVRRNKIKKLKSIESKFIRYLDISDNLLKDMDEVSNIKTLEILDCAYNLLENVPNLTLPSLKELYLMANDICAIENIHFPKLEKLDMANNNIKKIENIRTESISELYLGANEIQVIENILHLRRLKILDLQYNDLREIDCKNIPPSVEMLLLQGNKNLKSIVNIHLLKNLNTIGIKDTKVDCEFPAGIAIW